MRLSVITDGDTRTVTRRSLFSEIKKEEAVPGTLFPDYIIRHYMTMESKEILTDAKSRLQDILVAISWREIARNYFGKSSSWLYHKLDGIRSDGTPGGGFSETERIQLKEALEDLAARINTAASKL